jgi:hypothetical protein
MDDFDELMVGSFCTVGMMVNGRSQHSRVFDWVNDHSGTYPVDDHDIASFTWGEGPVEDVTMECEEEEELQAEVQRELAKGNVRAKESFLSMTGVDAAAEQSAREDSRIAARKAVIKAKAASLAQAEEERATLGVPISSAADTKLTCEYRESVRAPRAAATRPRIREAAMTKKAFAIYGILDSDAERGEVLVRWGSRHGVTWEPGA